MKSESLELLGTTSSPRFFLQKIKWIDSLYGLKPHSNFAKFWGEVWISLDLWESMHPAADFDECPEGITGPWDSSHSRKPSVASRASPAKDKDFLNST